MKRAILIAALSACTSRDIVASSAGPGSNTDPPAYCLGSGPPVLVGDGVTVGDGDGNPDDVCTGTVAVRTFVRALCTCEGYATSTTLATDSFDSNQGPYAPGGATGDVGIDGEIQSSAVLTIGGALAVAGTAGIAALAEVHVARGLDAGGPLGTHTSIDAGGDAHIAGNVDLAQLTVAGTLTIPATASLGTTNVTAGQTVRAPVTVTPPCACGDDDLVDIPAFVAAYAEQNDDAAIGLSPGQLTGYTGDASLDLPCGIYYVGPVHGTGALALRITGRVALLVDGDLAMQAPLSVELATDDAELDLMVAGLISSNHAIVIGRTDHPSRTRVYAGGTGMINLSGDSQIAANVYAPRASLAVSADATIFGSLFVRRLAQAAPVTIHYDIDVRRADVGCPVQ